MDKSERNSLRECYQVLGLPHSSSSEQTPPPAPPAPTDPPATDAPEASNATIDPPPGDPSAPKPKLVAVVRPFRDCLPSRQSRQISRSKPYISSSTRKSYAKFWKEQFQAKKQEAEDLERQVAALRIGSLTKEISWDAKELSWAAKELAFEKEISKLKEEHLRKELEWKDKEMQYKGNLSEQLLEANDDRTAPEVPLITSLDLPNNRVQTSAVIVFQVFLMIDLLVASFILPYFPDLPVPLFSFIVYLHCIVWALSYILDAYLRKQHTLLSCYGFIDFYQKTKTLRRTSLNVMSSGSILMLIISVVIADYCPQRLQCPGDLGTVVYLQIVIALETIVLLPVYLYYLKLNHEFHRNKAQPDIEPPNFITSIIQNQSTVEIGYRDNNLIEDTVEKQSDMIRYLKQYNTYLKKKVLRLSGELENSRNRSLVNV